MDLKERNGRHRLDITVNRIRRENSGKSNVVFREIYFAVENGGENYFDFCYNEK